ncbi:S8 family serine peptidase [Actinomadura madurae]|uniref:S8 family serine peptidase n=1 Tax=Actinomadura madurae TaxID=1993 RepID=UPI0020D22130|nr:S8 family serine peptidase [Actinomadura madurae]MCP9980050.1 S8 family serine peptidase [Actinomadura madurae]
MRWLLRTAAATAAIGLAAAPVVPAQAAPGPRSDQWWFDSWSIQKEVWPVTKGKGVTVAVIDTGVNAQLPDLKPVVLPGTDLTGKGGDGRQDTDAYKHGHGTGMASLIASQGTKTGFVGVAPEARILPIAASVSGTTTGKAVRYAVDHGAKVINISEGSESAAIYPNQCPPQLLEAVQYAAAKDVVIVASAGNTGDNGNKPSYPASCPGVLAVGALGHDGKPWKSTQRQPYVTVAAPGTDVGWINKEGHAYNAGEGTSQASALAAGAAALVRSRDPRMPGAAGRPAPHRDREGLRPARPGQPRRVRRHQHPARPQAERAVQRAEPGVRAARQGRGREEGRRHEAGRGRRGLRRLPDPDRGRRRGRAARPRRRRVPVPAGPQEARRSVRSDGDGADGAAAAVRGTAERRPAVAVPAGPAAAAAAGGSAGGRSAEPASRPLRRCAG